MVGDAGHSARRAARGLVLLAVAGGLALAAWRCAPAPTPKPGPVEDQPAPPPVTLRGVVWTPDGPAEGAIVRIQATENVTRSGPNGEFALRVPAGEWVTVTAWVKGHYIGGRDVPPEERPFEIELRPHYVEDNEAYDWFSEEGAEGSRSCGHCMPGHYAEWKADAHSRSAVNPRFLSMYNGTDLRGRRSTMVRSGRGEAYGPPPGKPDPNRPYYGPGFKLDYPDENGDCAACHAPAAVARPNGQLDGDVNDLSPIEKEGVFCEFCHKIGEVVLDPSTGLPYWHTPGMNSIRLYRPPDGRQLFFGTFDDVTRRVTYSPLLAESAFCSPCHWGMFSGVLVYNSFGEWYDSPYNHPKTGKTCQDCHMPPTQDAHFVRPEKGGLRRKPGRIYTHRMPGADDVAFLQDTARLELRASRSDGRVLADVNVTNEKGGHHIPTGHPARNILLVVSATDAAGNDLEHLGRQVLPPWAGEGSEESDYAGRPGKGYAKVLEELWSGTYPTAAYWRQTTLREDTRIEAKATDETHYEFRAPAGPGAVTVRAKLIYRRAFKDLARQKGWELKDIPMEQAEAVVR